jgi:high-affinity iron transporter
MLATFFLMLREGLEAALIVGIVAAYLVRIGRRDALPKVAIGVAAAIGLSVAIGVVVTLTIERLPIVIQDGLEGVAALLAVGVLTWMLFWMRRQAAGVKGELQAAVDRVLTEGSMWGLAFVAFTAVIREGVETSLLLVAQVAAADSSSGSVLAGAVIGLSLAGAIGYGFYRGSRRVHLGTFFRWTGIALIFIAAGLLSHAVHEFIDIRVIGLGTQTAFDISALLPHESGLGELLRALFGYTSTPEVLTLAVWITYLVVVLTLYLRPLHPPTPARREVIAPQS